MIVTFSISRGRPSGAAGAAAAASTLPVSNSIVGAFGFRVQYERLASFIRLGSNVDDGFDASAGGTRVNLVLAIVDAVDVALIIPAHGDFALVSFGVGGGGDGRFVGTFVLLRRRGAVVIFSWLKVVEWRLRNHRPHIVEDDGVVAEISAFAVVLTAVGFR